MSSDALLAIANLLLPEVLVTYFDLTKHEVKGEEIHFYFTELNTAFCKAQKNAYHNNKADTLRRI